MSTKTSYRCDNGQMISALTKAVFPLLDSDADTGCFACMSANPYTFFATLLLFAQGMICCIFPDVPLVWVSPGSHKSNYVRPWSSVPEDNPPLVPVPARAGDCIVRPNQPPRVLLPSSAARAVQRLGGC